MSGHEELAFLFFNAFRVTHDAFSRVGTGEPIILKRNTPDNIDCHEKLGQAGECPVKKSIWSILPCLSIDVVSIMWSLETARVIWAVPKPNEHKDSFRYPCWAMHEGALILVGFMWSLSILTQLSHYEVTGYLFRLCFL